MNFMKVDLYYLKLSTINKLEINNIFFQNLIYLFTKMLKCNIHLTLSIKSAYWARYGTIYNLRNNLKENRNENLNYQLRRLVLSRDLPFLQKIQYVVLMQHDVLFPSNRRYVTEINFLIIFHSQLCYFSHHIY